MKFRIDGADAKTGAIRSVVIDAADQMDAQRWARESGILVSSIQPASQPAKEDVAVTPAKREIPEYEALRLVAWLFRLNALAAYVIGGVGLVLAAVFVLWAFGNDRETFNRGLFCLIWASGAFVYGLSSHAVSEFLTAFRDLVRNSFK